MFCRTQDIKKRHLKLYIDVLFMKSVLEINYLRYVQEKSKLSFSDTFETNLNKTILTKVIKKDLKVSMRCSHLKFNSVPLRPP